MQLLPTSLKTLVAELSKLPGVGEKTALRYAVSLLKDPSQRLQHLQRALSGVQTDVSICPTCYFWAQQSHCPLCENESRQQARTLCVVRDCPDVLSLEKFKTHPWRYHILQGVLSPLMGIGPRQIRIEALMKRLESMECEEVILALDATVEGDATSLFIRDQIKNHFPHIHVTRTSQGLPVGSSVEFLDPGTLESALSNRIALE